MSDGSSGGLVALERERKKGWCAMNGVSRLLVFALGERSYALRVEVVERVIRAVEVTPLPESLPFVLGVINIQGSIVPVFDLRWRFHLPGREVVPEDSIIVARIAKPSTLAPEGRAVALVADEVREVIEVEDRDLLLEEGALPGLGYLEGVARLPDGLLLIQDLDAFLSPEEGKSLEEALRSV